MNLPAADKMIEPRYQNLEADQVTLLASEDDGGALVRIIAGDVDGHRGPGSTHTPIAVVHASVAPGAQLGLPWPADFNALAYVLAGVGAAGPHAHPIRTGQLAVFGPGSRLTLSAAANESVDVLILGGRPIREPVFAYGPFVMNTKAEIVQALDDFQAGRLGVVPANALMPYAG